MSIYISHHNEQYMSKCPLMCIKPKNCGKRQKSHAINHGLAGTLNSELVHIHYPNCLDCRNYLGYVSIASILVNAGGLTELADWSRSFQQATYTMQIDCIYI